MVKMHRSNIQAALAHHVSASLAARVELPAWIELGDLQKVLGSALIEALVHGASGEVELVRVYVSGPEGSFALEPDEARRFPWLAGYLPPSRAEAIALPFAAGAISTDQMLAFSEVGKVQIVDHGDGFVGGVNAPILRNGDVEVHVTAAYGPVSARPSFAIYRTFEAGALFMAGQTARALQVGGRASKSAILGAKLGAQILH